ncbi:MAG: histone deacetylase family protein [Candidatus Bathyarchaeia archaeon]|nr:MAG: histone deacetylase [Candidatus Bathyarchaeota archaeon]
MARTAVIFSPKYYRHDTGRSHPESAKRVGVIVNELKRGKIAKSKNWQFVKPRKASLEEIQLVHDPDYIKFVKDFCRCGGGFLDSGDTVVSAESFEVAKYAVGGTLKTVDLVMEKQFENAFALVRPPGHHAGKFSAAGFCIFNNVAIAAKYLLRKFGLKRILIFDIDAHHGNGTQEIFYETDRVLYVSLHEDPRSFPGTGFMDEVGEGEGLGYNVNIPLPFGANDQVYLKALKEIAIPIVSQYKPQFMLVSAGLDGHYTDPVANLSLSALCYEKVYGKIIELASQMCDGKLVFALEGGYSLKFVGKLAALAIARMSGSNYTVNDRVVAASAHVKRQCGKVLNEVKKIQGSFWSLG